MVVIASASLSTGRLRTDGIPGPLTLPIDQLRQRQAMTAGIDIRHLAIIAFF
jgi:hypothetical protein